LPIDGSRRIDIFFDVKSFSQQLLPVLQLTRMALVFTALADSGCALMLWAKQQVQLNGKALWYEFSPAQCLALAMVSIGLYGFGMSLNDIIDRRRDRQISPHRPLPSGRIGLGTAHVVCALLALLALIGGEIYRNVAPNARLSLGLVGFTGALIVFYDFAAKYLAPLGLLSLGLIRFFHATIAAPSLPVIWQPLLLMNHVTIVSTLAYHWEHKRPALRPVHWWSVFLGLGLVDAVAIGLVWWRRRGLGDVLAGGILTIRPALWGPAAAALAFVALTIWIRHRSVNSRAAGRTLMLAGLMWLIVYDASFVAGFVGVPEGIMVLGFLPVTYAAVIIMRWWSKVMLLSQRPEFKRVETN
jgi:4-hydroxybenzoate polyprenyltransferase